VIKKIVLNISIFLLVFIISFCQKNSANDQVTLKNEPAINQAWMVEKYDLERGEPLSADEWECYDAAGDRFCIPRSWEPVKQNKVWFLSHLDTKDKRTYFAVVKVELEDTLDMDLFYLQKMYAEYLADSVEQLTGSSLRKLTFAENVVFDAELSTAVGEKRYKTYSVVLQENEYLFEIGLKVEESESASAKEIFRNILYNVKFGRDSIFTNHNKLEKIEFVDFSKL
jgi:hypothetical protein